MFFVTPNGCPNHGFKLKLGKNYNSNNSIWLAVMVHFTSAKLPYLSQLIFQLQRPSGLFMAYLKRGIGFVDRFNEPIRGKGPPCIPNLGKRALSLSSVPKSARQFIQRGRSVVKDYIFQL